MRWNGRRTKLIESASKALANATFAKEGEYYFSYNYNAGRVAEWFKAPVLKFAFPRFVLSLPVRPCVV